ncbi:ATP-binding cassette domain-containing protein [Rhodococcus sp. UNC23MFCrub1.1]|uniref:ATP-binding cassette domain-containing protein n=1 Tax=Rhodococcus sp. UNC23MFCrub1.1 TaxID=1449068 RepID=UPI001E28D2BC|nr:ATP-binding cassette domain-containing protein [Rhodococcus sp. UNC23MFCrub1.1]
MNKKAAAAKADHLIEMTGLTGIEGALPHELSGGIQQRVSLCRALLHGPEVLLMDKPFGALDALTREKMNVELHRIWKETGTTVMLDTHSVAEAVYLANRVVGMSPRPEFISVVNTVRDMRGVPRGDGLRSSRWRTSHTRAAWLGADRRNALVCYTARVRLLCTRIGVDLRRLLRPRPVLFVIHLYLSTAVAPSVVVSTSARCSTWYHLSAARGQRLLSPDRARRSSSCSRVLSSSLATD